MDFHCSIGVLRPGDSWNGLDVCYCLRSSHPEPKLKQILAWVHVQDSVLHINRKSSCPNAPRLPCPNERAPRSLPDLGRVHPETRDGSSRAQGRRMTLGMGSSGVAGRPRVKFRAAMAPSWGLAILGFPSRAHTARSNTQGLDSSTFGTLWG